MLRLPCFMLSVVMVWTPNTSSKEHRMSSLIEPLSPSATKFSSASKPVVVLRPQVRRIPRFESLLADSVPQHRYAIHLLNDAEIATLHAIQPLSSPRHYLSNGDRLHAPVSTTLSEVWGVYRRLQSFTRQVSSDNVSSRTAFLLVAQARVIQDQPHWLSLENVHQEVRPSDVLMPLETSIASDVETNSNSLPNAQLLGSVVGERYIATDRWLVIDKGYQDGMQRGAHYRVTKGLSGTQAVGELQVMRVYPRMSVAKVVTSQMPIRSGYHAWPTAFTLVENAQ